MSIKLVVYDCDGVLFDSSEAVKAYYDYVFDKFDLEQLDWSNPDHFRNAMMMTNDQIINHFVKDQEKVNEILEFAKNLNFKKFTPMMIPETNIHETLEVLRDKKYHLAIFTNRGISLDYLLEYFDILKFFPVRVTCFDVANPKPDPEGLYKILAHYGVEKNETIFIGDSPSDYHAAKSADVPFLSYKTELFESDVIDDHKSLLNYL